MRAGGMGRRASPARPRRAALARAARAGCRPDLPHDLPRCERRLPQGRLRKRKFRGMHYSVGSKGASACGSDASRAACSSSMNSRKALLRAKDSLPSK